MYLFNEIIFLSLPILQNQNMIFNVSCEMVIAEFIRYKRHDRNRTRNRQKRRAEPERSVWRFVNRPTVHWTVQRLNEPSERFREKIWPLHCQIFLWTVERFIEQFNGLWTVERFNEPFQRFMAQRWFEAYLRSPFPPNYFFF